MLNKQYLLLALIILLGLIIRFYSLTTSPEGLSIDEASFGYNAYSIVQTGYDEHQKFMPFFFEAFGEYKLPILVYLIAFIQLFLGPSDLSIRLPVAIFGILSIPMMFFLTKQLLSGSSVYLRSSVSLISALLLCLSPWHYQFSRPGFEAGIGMFLLMLAVYLFLKAEERNSSILLLFSFLSFALTFYTYNSARIIVPILILTLLALFHRSFKFNIWLKAFSVLIVVLMPFFAFIGDSASWTRAKEVVIFYYLPLNQAVTETVKNYLNNISLNYLFFIGDPTIARDTPYRWGLLHLVELPFFIFGLMRLFLDRKKENLFIAVYLLVGFIPSAIAVLSPHALRSLFVLPVLIFISAYGLGSFLQLSIHRLGKIIILVTYFVLLIQSEIFFLNTYHKEYLLEAGWDWQVGIKRATTFIKSKEEDFASVYFEESGPAKISYLWYLKYPPSDYQRSVDKFNLGKYHFKAKIGDISYGNNLFVTGNCDLSIGQIIKEVNYPNGSRAFCIWNVSK